MNKSLLDTDLYSEILKAANPTVIRHASEYRRHHGTLTLSAVTMMEIVYGLRRKQDDRRHRVFLAAVGKEEVLPFDPAAAELAGRIAGDLDRSGLTIGMADPMIAAIALIHGLELVTGNTAHYERVRQLGHPLTLANWRI